MIRTRGDRQTECGLLASPELACRILLVFEACGERQGGHRRCPVASAVAFVAASSLGRAHCPCRSVDNCLIEVSMGSRAIQNGWIETSTILGGQIMGPDPGAVVAVRNRGKANSNFKDPVQAVVVRSEIGLEFVIVAAGKATVNEHRLD